MSCVLVCHDKNHNGDIAADKGCGNPECWKHRPGDSTPPAPFRPDHRCTCAMGTFLNDPVVFSSLPIGADFKFYYGDWRAWWKKTDRCYAIEIKYSHLKQLIAAGELCLPCEEDRNGPEE